MTTTRPRFNLRCSQRSVSSRKATDLTRHGSLRFGHWWLHDYHFILVTMRFVIAFIVLSTLITVSTYVYFQSLRIASANTRFSPLTWAATTALVYVALMSAKYALFPNDLRFLANYMGWLTFAFCSALGFWLIWLLAACFKVKAWLSSRVIFGMLLSMPLILSAIASYNFQKPIAVQEFTITSDKVSRAYRFVQLSDIQYGSISKNEMDDILAQAYALKPEFIVFTGDLVDFEGFKHEDFEKLANSPVPFYFERGNHEFYHHPERLMSYLTNIAPIELLINQGTHFEELYIVGLDYHQDHHNVAKQLAKLPLPANQFSILLYHEPLEVEVAAAHGFDLQLYGHTHAGQIWPFTWLVDVIYDYADGQFQVGNSFVYTTDGASLWGPRMRLGSQNEMALFHVVPANQSVSKRNP